LGYEDLLDHAKLQRELSTPICLDESLTSAEKARKAMELGSGRVFNVKPARLGGHGESLRVHALAQSAGIPLWMGGMLEAGVGRAHNLHLATLPGFTKPGDVSSASRYWEEDIVEEALEAKEGLMPVPEGPGIGVHLKLPLVERITLWKGYWSGS
jgi:O-succinylbenzoate synthase